jgi:general secretion pathway protein C
MNGVISHRLINVFNAGLVVLLLIVIPLFTRDVMSQYMRTVKEREKPVTPKPLAPPASARPFHDYDTIVRNNPFGIADTQLTMLTPSPSQEGASRDVRLVGTIAGQGRYLYGIFSDAGGKQEVFKSGDSVFGLGTLTDVRKDKAILRREGRTTEVPLADIGVTDDATSAKDKLARGEVPAFVKSTGRDTYVVDQKAVLHALENPNQLMTDARLQPNLVGGRQEGFVLREVRQGGIYHSLGLMNGDVLLRINNYDISHPDNALQAFSALRGMDRVALDIVRNGAKTTLTYQIK